MYSNNSHDSRALFVIQHFINKSSSRDRFFVIKYIKIVLGGVLQLSYFYAFDVAQIYTLCGMERQILPVDCRTRQKRVVFLFTFLDSKIRIAR